MSVPLLALPVRATQLECPIAESPEGRVWSLINCYGYDLAPNVQKQILETIRCESGFNPTIAGDNGQSIGLAQIHLPAHPYVTKEMAQNPEYAVTFIVNNFRQGKQKLWTCWRNLYGQGNSQENNLA